MDTQNKIIWPGWETVRVIGRGSFGTVYEIRRDILGDIERAALKHISIPVSEEEIISLQSEGMDAASITKTFREQLNDIVNEYKLMRRLNDCPYVVRCDDVQYIQKQDGFGWDIFIKMELLTPVTRLLGADTEITEDKVVALGKDISRALIRCREQNILHRDIKIQNIFVAEDGKYKLGDFGIARAKERTSTGTARVGTYDYMAPEIYWGKRYDKTADIYSLGMVMYWLLNNRRMPFLPQTEEAPRMQDRENARMRRLNGEKLPPPVNGSKRLQKIVLKCCAYKPEDRYRDPSDLLNDLLALTRKPVVKKAVPAKRARQAPESKNSLDPLPELTSKSEHVLQPEEEPKANPKKRSGWRIVWRIIGVIYLLIAIAVGIIVFQAKRESKEEDAWELNLGEFDNISELVRALNDIEISSRSEDDATVGISEIGTEENTIIVKLCDKSLRDSFTRIESGDTDSLTAYDQIIAFLPEYERRLERALEKSYPGIHVNVILMKDEYSDTVVAVAENRVIIYDLVNNIGTAPVGMTPIMNKSGYVQEPTPMPSLSEASTTVSLPSTGASTDPRNEEYKAAEDLLASGDKAHAAMAFYKLGDYKDSHERSFALWDQIAERHTVADEGRWVGLKSDGTVISEAIDSWAQDIHKWTDIAAVAAGHYITVGLKSDGTVVAVMDESYSSECDVSGWTDIVAIQASLNVVAGLRADGTVLIAGDEYLSSCVSDWTDIVALELYSTKAIYGVRADGTVVSNETMPWTSWNQDTYVPGEISDWTNIVSVSTSGVHTVGLKSDGTVVAIGYKHELQCDVSTWTDIVMIATGQTHTVGLRKNGTVITTLDPQVPAENFGQRNVSLWTDIVDIFAGRGYTVGLKADGSLVSAGNIGNPPNWTDIAIPKGATTHVSGGTVH
jgi:serine/threonine protein kinase